MDDKKRLRVYSPFFFSLRLGKRCAGQIFTKLRFLAYIKYAVLLAEETKFEISFRARDIANLLFLRDSLRHSTKALSCQHG